MDDKDKDTMLEGIVNGIRKHAQDIIADKAPLERRKVQWPEPGKIPFTLERTYDPMNMSNREGPLKLPEVDPIPRRRHTDRDSED